eukprot:gene9248-1335_t
MSADEASTDSSTTKSETKERIKITRNISATSEIICESPVKLPEHDILYVFDVKNWTHPNSFYDSIECSFGTPSTQKQVFCNYFNKKVMHYERTCQGIYTCPKSSKNENDRCFRKLCHLRHQTCEKHGQLMKKTQKCSQKLHFYVPLEKSDTRRIFILCGGHNHELIEEKDINEMQNYEKRSSSEDLTNGEISFQTQTPQKKLISKMTRLPPKASRKKAIVEEITPKSSEIQSSEDVKKNETKKQPEPVVILEVEQTPTAPVVKEEKKSPVDTFGSVVPNFLNNLTKFCETNIGASPNNSFLNFSPNFHLKTPESLNSPNIQSSFFETSPVLTISPLNNFSPFNMGLPYE